MPGIDVQKTVEPRSCSSSIRSSRLCLATETRTHSATVQWWPQGRGGHVHRDLGASRGRIWTDTYVKHRQNDHHHRRLLDRDSFGRPLPLGKDGDLIALPQYMIRTRGRDTVRVTKVKGHAEDVDVQQGRVRLLDQQGHADTAADLGRRHQSEVLIDARRRLLKVRGYCILLCLICIGLWLLLLGFLLNVTGGAVLLLIGIRVVSLKLASLLLGSMLILPLSLVLLVSWVGHGFNFMG